MTPQLGRRTRRTRTGHPYATGWIAPAAVLGSLAGSLVLAPSAAAEDHVVVDGDTLFDLARRFDISVAELRNWNALHPDDLLHPGDVLRTAAPTPTEDAVSAGHAAASVDAPAEKAYEVVAGDTLWAIARTHSTTVEAIYAANGLGPDSIIYPGQTLLLSPAGAVAALPSLSAVAPDEEPSEEPAPPLAPSTALDAEQAHNAARIIAIGDAIGVPERGIEIALAAAMVESNLRNLSHGDRDSIGLFQQRASTGWGTPEQIADPEHSIRAFFLGVTGPDGPTALGLLDLGDWESLPFTDAAQAVQLSAYPLRYGAWELQAKAWVAAHR